MLAQEVDDYLGRKIRDEPEIKSRHRSTRQNRFRARFGMSGVNTADRAGWTKDMFLDERMSLHCTDPAANPKFTFESDFIEFNRFQNFGIFVTNRSDVRRESIDGDNTFRRSERCQGLDQAPRWIRHDRSPLRMQIRASAKRAQFEKRDAFETETYDRILPRVARTFVPQTTIRLQELRIFTREAIKTRAAESVFALDDETQRHWKFA